MYLFLLVNVEVNNKALQLQRFCSDCVCSVIFKIKSNGLVIKENYNLYLKEFVILHNMLRTTKKLALRITL